MIRICLVSFRVMVSGRGYPVCRYPIACKQAARPQGSRRFMVGVTCSMVGVTLPATPSVRSQKSIGFSIRYSFRSKPKVNWLLHPRSGNSLGASLVCFCGLRLSPQGTITSPLRSRRLRRWSCRCWSRCQRRVAGLAGRLAAEPVAERRTSRQMRLGKQT